VALGNLELVPTDTLPAWAVDHLANCRESLLQMADTVDRLRVAEDRVVPYLGSHGMIDLRGDAGS
jgi:hypothetical protein